MLQAFFADRFKENLIGFNPNPNRYMYPRYKPRYSRSRLPLLPSKWPLTSGAGTRSSLIPNWPGFPHRIETDRHGHILMNPIFARFSKPGQIKLTTNRKN